MNYYNFVSAKRLQRCVLLISEYINILTSEHIESFGSDLLKDYVLTSAITVNAKKQIFVDLNLKYVGLDNFDSIFKRHTFDAHQLMHERNNPIIGIEISEVYHKLILETANHIEKLTEIRENVAFL